MAVVPPPKNVSKTVSPSFECFLINSSNNNKLFCVGCILFFPHCNGK